MILSRKDIIRLQEEEGLIEGAVDFEKQLTPQGIDITVKEVHELLDEGCIDFDNTKRKLPQSRKLEWDGDKLFLKPGVYKVVTNEIFKLPLDIAAICQPRTSLLRSGAFVATGVWDAGFYGRAEFVLHVQNPHGLVLMKNARIAQLLFIKLSWKTDKPYRGIFYGQK